MKRGFRTYVPAGTALHSVTIANGVATVDLGARFTAGERASLLARLSQLVRTLTIPPQVKSVQLLIDGAKVSGVFPGVPTADPITFAFLATPNRPVPKPPERKRGPVDAHVKSLQSRLIALSYLRVPPTAGLDLRHRTPFSRSRSGSGSPGPVQSTQQRKRGLRVHRARSQ